MKKQNLIVVCMVAAMMQPLSFMAQSQNSAAKRHEDTKTGWQPVKLDDKGSNVQNGVEFYSQKGNCNSGKVTLAKVVNTNNYAVNISYQVSPESPIISILVPASATMEGSCAVTEGNLGKLVIKLSETGDAKNNGKQHLLSHITVSKN